MWSQFSHEAIIGDRKWEEKWLQREYQGEETKMG